MKRVVCAFVVLLASSGVLCEETKAPLDEHQCPVKFLVVNPKGNDSFGGALFKGGNAHANDGKMFVLKLKNTSTKTIRGMKFQASYYDATHDLHDIPVAWNWTVPIKPDEEKSFRWENNWHDTSVVGWRVLLLKVLFDDETKWEPSAESACFGENRKKGAH